MRGTADARRRNQEEESCRRTETVPGKRDGIEEMAKQILAKIKDELKTMQQSRVLEYNKRILQCEK
jgi:hypothetical protein